MTGILINGITSWEFVLDLLECILYAEYLHHLGAFGQMLQVVFANGQPNLPEETNGYGDEHVLIEDGSYVIERMFEDQEVPV